jgi:hypothetical protein
MKMRFKILTFLSAVSFLLMGVSALQNCVGVTPPEEGCISSGASALTISGTTSTGLRAGPWLGFRGPNAITFWCSPNYPNNDGGTLNLQLDGGKVDGGDAGTQWLDGGFKDSGLVHVVVKNDGAVVAEQAFPLLTMPEVSSSTTVSGLEADTTYSYSYVVDGFEDVTSRSVFRTALPTGVPGEFSIAAVSCEDATLYPTTGTSAPSRQPWYAKLLSLRPRMMIHLGDTTYTENYNARGMQGHVRVSRNDPNVRALTSSVAMLAGQDDHECSGQDWDKTFANKPQCWQSFLENFPSPATSTIAGAWWFKSSFADVDIFMLDTRSWRDVKTSTNPNKSILGSAQKAWLLRELLASTARFKLIASPSAFYGSSNTQDSWRVYPADYYWLAYTVASQVNGMVMLVGDLHQAYTISQTKLGPYPRWIEIVTSGLAQSAFYTPGAHANCRYNNTFIDDAGVKRDSGISASGLPRHFLSLLRVNTTTIGGHIPEIVVDQYALTEGGGPLGCWVDGGTGIDGGLRDLGIFDSSINVMGRTPIPYPAADGGTNIAWFDGSFRITIDMVSVPDSGVGD